MLTHSNELDEALRVDILECLNHCVFILYSRSAVGKTVGNN